VGFVLARFERARVFFFTSLLVCAFEVFSAGTIAAVDFARYDARAWPVRFMPACADRWNHATVRQAEVSDPVVDPVSSVVFGWREVALTLSVALSTLLGIVWRRTVQDVNGKVDKQEIEQLVEQVRQHMSDDKELLREIRRDRELSEHSRSALHEKINRLAVGLGRVEGRLPPRSPP